MPAERRGRGVERVRGLQRRTAHHAGKVAARRGDLGRPVERGAAIAAGAAERASDPGRGGAERGDRGGGADHVREILAVEDVRPDHVSGADPHDRHRVRDRVPSHRDRAGHRRGWIGGRRRKPVQARADHALWGEIPDTEPAAGHRPRDEPGPRRERSARPVDRRHRIVERQRRGQVVGEDGRNRHRRGRDRVDDRDHDRGDVRPGPQDVDRVAGSDAPNVLGERVRVELLLAQQHAPGIGFEHVAPDAAAAVLPCHDADPVPIGDVGLGLHGAAPRDRPRRARRRRDLARVSPRVVTGPVAEAPLVGEDQDLAAGALREPARVRDVASAVLDRGAERAVTTALAQAELLREHAVLHVEKLRDRNLGRRGSRVKTTPE